MTVRYLGMNSQTGLSITEVEHIRQSVRDILVTPVGSRVMRREYGSLLSALIDQPQTHGTAIADYGRVLFRDPEVGAARQADHHHL
jgi:phage baseplate assembly protein W